MIWRRLGHAVGWFGVLSVAVLTAGCAREGCLGGEEGCVMPTPCEALDFECAAVGLSIHRVGDGQADDPPGGPVALASDGDVHMSNGRISVVVDDLYHPHFLAPTGGSIIDISTAGEANDSFRQLFQATGVLPDEAAAYTSMTLFEGEDFVAVQVSGTLDGRSQVPIHTRYELRSCEPGIRIRTELVNLEPDPISVLLADGTYYGKRELLPFTPGLGKGFDQPSFGLSTLGDAVFPAPFMASATHQGPAVSYAAVACNASSIVGFRGDEVAADGLARTVLMSRDYLVYERFVAVGEGASVADAADVALGVREQLFEEKYVEVSGQLDPGDGDPGFSSPVRASVLLSEGNSSQERSQRTPWNQVYADSEGRWSAHVPAGASMVAEIEAFGRVAAEFDFEAGEGNRDVGTWAIPTAGSLKVSATVDGEIDHVLAFVRPADDATTEAVIGSHLGNFDVCAPLLGKPTGASPACNRILIHGSTVVGLLPGTYDIYAVAGPFSTLAAVRDLEVVAGVQSKASLAIETLDLKPTDTLTADFHVHGSASFDAEIPDIDRVASFLASRLDVIASTEHDSASNYAEAIEALGASDRLALLVGTESTGHILSKLMEGAVYPKVIGHWNIWPLTYDPRAPYRGAPWDEKTLPGGLFQRAQDLGWPADTGVIQLNHPIGGLSFGRDFGWASVLELDLTEPLPSVFDGTYPSLFSATPAGASFSNDAYHAQEVMNGTNNDSFLQYRAFWHYLLNQGILKAGTANSDSHSLAGNVVGIPTTLVWSDNTLDTFDPVSFNASVREGRMVGTTGPILQVWTTDGKGGIRGPSLESFVPASDAQIRIRIDAAPWVPVEEVRILVNGAVAQTLTEPLSHAFNPLGTTGTERLDLELALNDLLPESGDAWIVVEAGLALEENWDLDCDGIPDTGDNNRDGEIDWRDIEEYVGAEEEPLGPCFDAVGPLTDPPAPTSRDDVLYLYQSVAPDGYPLAFSNPLLIDRDGDGWTAPGLR